MSKKIKVKQLPKRHLAFLIAIITIACTIGGIILNKYELNRTFKRKGNTLASITYLKSTQISEWFREKITDVQTIADSPFLEEVARTYIRTNSYADSSRLSGLLKQIRLEHGTYEVILATIDGLVIASANEQRAELEGIEKKSIETALNQEQAVSTDFFKCEHDGDDLIFISFIAVVRDDENNPVASVVLRIDPAEFLYPLVENWPIPSQTAESIIFRLDADSIKILNNLRHIQNTALDLKIPTTQADNVAIKAALGATGIITGKNYFDRDVVSYSSRIEATPWFIVSEIDRSELTGGIPILIGRIFAFFLVLILFSIAFIMFIYTNRQKNIYQQLYTKEKELWLQQEKFKITMDSLGDGVIISNMDAKVQYLNYRAEELTGWTAREAEGRVLGEIYQVKNEETGEKEDNILEKVIKHGIVKELANHTLLVSKNGEEIPVTDNGAPVYDADGSLSGIVITFQDETEKRTQSRLLRKSEKNLREFFEYDITGDYAATADGELIQCNPALSGILGFDSPDELIGRNILEFYRDPGKREDNLNILQVSKTLKNFEMILKHKDGSELFCKENIVGVFDGSGNLERYFGYLQDITIQKESEEKLYNREQLLASVVETQREIIARYLPDSTLTFVNKAYCIFFGKTEEELIGNKFLQFVPESEWEHELSILRSLNTINPQRTSVSRAIKEDGSEVILEWTDTAVFDEINEVIEIQSIGTDVTEKIKAENELSFLLKMNELLRRIAADYISLPVHETDSYIEMSLGEIGKFIKADRVYVFDYDWELHTCSNTFEWCEDLIEPQIEHLQNVSLDDIPHWWNPHKQGLPLIVDDVLALEESDVVRQILEPQKVKSLITIPIMGERNCLGFVGLDYVQDYYSPSKREKEVLFVFADVLASIKKQVKVNMELIKAREKAEESDKLKTAFINNISHEIRTPLNGILGFGQLLAESDTAPEQKIRMLQRVQQSSYRLMNTVSDYLDMAMLVSGNMEVHRKKFVLQPFFEEIIVHWKSSCEEKKIEFKALIPSGHADLSIKTDKELLKKSLSHLISNAIKFTSLGSISCGYRITHGFVEFFVQDTGTGISDEKLDMVFKMFVQEDPSNTRGYEGSGLGLTMTKGMINLLGGNINVTSEKGKGSTFTFTIPANDTGIASISAVNKATSPQNANKQLVLIAEDDDLNYLYLESVLEIAGCSSLRAVNGAEAVDLCRQNPGITLVLMDIKMPVMNGVEATKKIREFRPELPIIAITAYAQTGDEHRFLEAGCNDYLPKPIYKDKLLEIISKSYFNA